jgi:hypothetical protein
MFTVLSYVLFSLESFQCHSLSNDGEYANISNKNNALSMPP